MKNNLWIIGICNSESDGVELASDPKRMALARSTFQSNSVRNAEENLDDSRYCGKLVKEREKI